jgi:hypothetical protein
MSEEQENICGLCGESGADKIPHPIHWPTEAVPNTNLVHTSCEWAECRRAFLEYRSRVGPDGIQEFLRHC